MFLKLQVYTDGEWGNLATRRISGSAEELAHVTHELEELQRRWITTYDRFRGAPMRITSE